MTKLIIKGQSGQGIQLLGFVLANLLKDRQFQVAFSNEYSPLVRSGGSAAYLTFSKTKIENPIIESPDLEYDLAQKEIQKKLLAKRNDARVINMTLLGLILKDLNLKINEREIEKYLPKKLLKENIEAIRQGFSL